MHNRYLQEVPCASHPLILAACRGDFQSLEQFALWVGEVSLLGGEEVGCVEERLRAVGAALAVAAAYGRVDVADQAFSLLAPLRGEVQRCLPDFWIHNALVVRDLVRRYGATSDQIDRFCDKAVEAGPELAAEVLSELVAVARPSAVGAAALFADIADLRASKGGGPRFSDAVILEQWGFLLSFVDTPVSVSVLRERLITEGRNGLLAGAMAGLPAPEADLESDLMAAAKAGNLEALVEALARQPPRTLISSALRGAIDVQQNEVARMLHQALGCPPVDRFIPAMLEAVSPRSTSYGQPVCEDNPFALDCSAVSEANVLATVSNATRRHEFDRNKYLFAAGAPVNRAIALSILDAIFNSYQGLHVYNGGKNPDGELAPAAVWYGDFFGPNGRGARLVFSEDVEERLGRQINFMELGRQLAALLAPRPTAP